MKLVFALFLALALPAFAAAPKPSLNVKTLDGGSFDLASQQGKWVIVNFWATWCSPCLKELPDISAFVAAHKDKVAAIGMDFEDADTADIEKFLKTHPLSFPVSMVDVDNPPKDFGAPKGLPNTYVIAPDGHLAKTFLGPIQTRDLQDVTGIR
ncbi:MAG TPA: TlpA disulfide reductase family protein [Rudaea sp.]|jgi:thiol-disulfide isomerase/thioredoxin|nr:TlpA disulfide reductase family protein [Rudaea sp.]